MHAGIAGLARLRRAIAHLTLVAMPHEELLAQIPAFKSLAESDLSALGTKLGEHHVDPGEVIFRQGDSTDTSALYIIEDGRVEIHLGDGKSKVQLAALGTGQYFGELALFDGAPRSATAIALESCRLLTLDREHFVDFIKRDPDAALQIMSELGSRLRATNDLVRRSTEEFQKLGGMEALSAPYMQVGFWTMVKNRGVWLAVLFVGEMLTASAMGYYENEIARAVVLALFIPLIISSGGNSGSQATSLMIRSLATGELALSQWITVLKRELLSGASLGVMLGGIGFLRIILWQNLGWSDYGAHYLAIAATVWGSLIGVVLFGSTAGSMLPFMLRRVGFDPATSSAPFVATLVDVSGLVIYFTVASVVLRGILL